MPVGGVAVRRQVRNLFVDFVIPLRFVPALVLFPEQKPEWNVAK